LKKKTALLTGSNMGDREKFLHFAETEISLLGPILKKSKIYESAAWGKTDQGAFLNQCIIMETDMTPLELLHHLKGIEKKVGRVKTEKWGERVLDIDILFYDDLIMNTKELITPHPYMAERMFTLIPLAEIAAVWIHPVSGKTVAEMLEDCRKKEL